MTAHKINDDTMLLYAAASTKVVLQKCKTVRDNVEWYYG